MNWNDIFQYNDGNLYWKISPSSRIFIGDLAGYLRQDGYVAVEYNSKSYKVHRIIWEMHYGPIPEGYEIDHIWHNRQDNRIQNLRLVLKEENAKNRRVYINNSSGVTGVSWSRRDSRWLAQITIKGKTIHLGYFNELGLAIKARKEAEIKYGFHPNHGKKKHDENTTC